MHTRTWHLQLMNSIVEDHKNLVRQMLNVSSLIKYEYSIGDEFHGYAALLTDE